MQDLILSTSWAATAACFMMSFVVMFFVSGMAVLWVIMKLYYFMEVQWRKMRLSSEREIAVIRSESLMWTEKDAGLGVRRL